MLEVSGLQNRFRRHAVLDLDFQLETGGFCLILGENGAGKSTFLRCLLGLENFGGSVRFAGGEARAHIAGVLDEPMMCSAWTALR